MSMRDVSLDRMPWIRPAPERASSEHAIPVPVKPTAEMIGAAVTVAQVSARQAYEIYAAMIAAADSASSR